VVILSCFFLHIFTFLCEVLTIYQLRASDSELNLIMFLIFIIYTSTQ